MSKREFVIIGAGPAGLTAAYELTKRGIAATVLEKNDKVGGLARTENHHGYHFDLGGHRFFTKVAEVKALWHELLRDDFLRRPRLSRIFYQSKFFDYPLKPYSALKGLGITRSIFIVLSYIWWQIFPYGKEETFEQWVTNRFGRELFQTFFKTYTEKVWGIPCSELKAEWAAQRIKDLSLKTALLNMIVKPRNTIKTLIDEFEYPRFGPGMMWNVAAERVIEGGGTVSVNRDVIQINRTGNRIENVLLANGGQTETVTGSDFISSMPVTELIKKLNPPPPPNVLAAAGQLHYRDFLTVCLIVDKPDLFPDNWIYVHDPAVKLGRIQNFKNWSPAMVPDQARSSLGLEYFCTEGDEIWSLPDTDLIELGKQEIDRIGLARRADVIDGCVVRVPKAYPVYDSEYQDYLQTIKEFTATLQNLQTIGRNGLHRYNNQDHSMLTGMLAVRNMLDGDNHDLWRINAEDEYLEEVKASTGKEPEAISQLIEGALVRVFSKLNRVVFGVSLGIVSGLILAIMTCFMVLRDGSAMSPNLAILSEYLPGYSVTPLGIVIGLTYGFILGFITGWTFALLRNSGMILTLVVTHRRLERNMMLDLFRYF
jgi:protoporphyrinogen oxidase